LTKCSSAEAVEVADLVLVTCRPSVVDLRATTNTIRLCRIRGMEPHVVLTQVEPQGTLPDEARSTLAGIEVHVLKNVLGRRAAFHHSMIDGRAALEYAPQGKAESETRAVYREVCQLVGKSSRQHDGKQAVREKADA
jgi:chromosome partitioning protein